MDIILLVDSNDESVTELALAWNLSRSVILSSDSDILLLIFVNKHSGECSTGSDFNLSN